VIRMSSLIWMHDLSIELIKLQITKSIYAELIQWKHIKSSKFLKLITVGINFRVNHLRYSFRYLLVYSIWYFWFSIYIHRKHKVFSSFPHNIL
jgi:hypothetical protein